MRLFSRAGLLALVLAVACPTALADNSSGLKLDEVRTSQAAMREAALAGSGRFEHMKASKRHDVVERQDELLEMIEGKQRLEQLHPEQRTQLVNTLAWIEAAITQAEDSRIICRRERVLGSNRKVRICKSAAQIRREREEARDRLDGPPSSRMKDMRGL